MFRKTRLNIDFDAKAHDRYLYGYSLKDLAFDIFIGFIAISITITALLVAFKTDNNINVVAKIEAQQKQEEKLQVWQIKEQKSIKEYLEKVAAAEQNMNEMHTQLTSYEIDMGEDDYNALSLVLDENEKILTASNKKVEPIRDHLIEQNNRLRELLRLSKLKYDPTHTYAAEQQIQKLEHEYEAANKKRAEAVIHTLQLASIAYKVADNGTVTLQNENNTLK